MCCVRELTENRAGSLELSPGKQVKETLGGFENVRCCSEFKQNQFARELLCAVQRLAVFTLHSESSYCESTCIQLYSNMSFKTS